MRSRRIANAAVSAGGGILILRMPVSPKVRPAVTILFLAAADEHIKADHAVLIASADRRNVPREEILSLDALLRTLRDVGAVGQRDVVGKLLLDGDLGTARRGVGFRSQTLRIDLDPAHSENLLQPAAHGRIDRLADDQSAGLVRERSLA